MILFEACRVQRLLKIEILASKVREQPIRRNYAEPQCATMIMGAGTVGSAFPHQRKRIPQAGTPGTFLQELHATGTVAVPVCLTMLKYRANPFPRRIFGTESWKRSNSSVHEQ